jgi:hypothetical protein
MNKHPSVSKWESRTKNTIQKARNKATKLALDHVQWCLFWVLNAAFNIANQCNGCVECDLEERDVEDIQLCWNLTEKTRGGRSLVALKRVNNTRQQREWERKACGERRSCWYGRDTCLSLIGCPNFYLILSLNSIISLQINFLFLYQNSWFFFSINRDLVHLIWTQKKNQIFHSLNLIIIFLLVFILKF